MVSPTSATVSYELEADTASQVYEDDALRERLTERILKDLPLADLHYEVYVDGLNKRVQVTVEAGSIVELIDEVVHLVTHEDEAGDDWLSFGYAARPLINFSVGYSWTIKKDLVFLNAFRTDFSAINKADIDDIEDLNYIKTTDYNIYHYSAGVEFTIKRQRFIAGGDFAFGFKTNQQQFVNFSDPVEYNPENNRALQGPQNYNSNMYYFGFSIYVGATLNFIKNDDATPAK